jgi:hypothetical protein
MVQGEKSNMLTATSCMARTADPYARKAGHEAVQRMDTQMSKQSAKASASQPNASSSPATNYGSWGPVFQNKQNFAQMHWC